MKICETCNKENKSTRVYECEKCARNRRRKQDKMFFLVDLYNHIKNRCNNKSSRGNYLGKKICSKSMFLEKFINDESFNNLHKEWADNGYIYKYTPSIDRINNDGDYTIDNIQFITHSKNAGKDKNKLPILMFDLNGNFIKEWESKWQAHLELGIPNGNIVKVCYGKRRNAGGFIFKFKES